MEGESGPENTVVPVEESNFITLDFLDDITRRCLAKYSRVMDIRVSKSLWDLPTTTKSSAKNKEEIFWGPIPIPNPEALRRGPRELT